MEYVGELASSQVEFFKSIDLLEYTSISAKTIYLYRHDDYGWGEAIFEYPAVFLTINPLIITEWNDWEYRSDYYHLLQLGDSNHFIAISKTNSGSFGLKFVEFVDNKYMVLLDRGVITNNGIPYLFFIQANTTDSYTVKFLFGKLDSATVDLYGYGVLNSVNYIMDGDDISLNYNNAWYSPALPYEPTPIPPNKGNKGNKGDRNNDSDTIDRPTPPINSPINNGLLHAYTINNTQLSQLGNFLWSNDFIDTIYKNFSSPMEAIISLCQCRYPVPSGSGDTQIKIGNCETGVYAHQITSNYCIIDCGNLTIDEYFGNSLDYDPYTKISIMLPYIGNVPLDCDIVMGSTINVTYIVDCITGTGLCYIYIARNSDGTNLNAPIYTYPCNCNISIPVSASDFSNVYSSAISGLLSLTQAKQLGAIDTANSLANSVMSAKSHVEKSGNISGSSGLFSIQKPYVIIERPIDAYAEDYNKYNGLPCNMTYSLAKMKGFTKISNIKISITKATEEENREIENLLKEGVYI